MKRAMTLGLVLAAGALGIVKAQQAPENAPKVIEVEKVKDNLYVFRGGEAVKPAAGDRVLILGAPGGVGSLAVQLAAAAGAHVVASGSAEDEAYLRDLGAADVIEPGGGLIEEVRARYPHGISGLIDLVDYRPAFLAHAELLVPGGRAASVHRAVDEVRFAERGLHGSNVSSFPDRALLEQLATLAAHGSLRTVITGRYSLDEAPAALAAARDGHTRGKFVIEVAD